MKITDISIWRVMEYTIIVSFVLVLAFSIQYNNIRPVFIMLIILCFGLIARACFDYFDDVRLSRPTKIYREKKKSDMIIRFHNTKYYIGVNPVYIDADGVRIADIAKGKNADIPIPKNAKKITISMKKTINIIELVDLNPDVRINTWVRYLPDKSRRLECTLTTGDERFNDNRLMEAYDAVMKRHQSVARSTIAGTLVILGILIVMFVAFN